MRLSQLSAGKTLVEFDVSASRSPLDVYLQSWVLPRFFSLRHKLFNAVVTGITNLVI